MSHLAMGTVKRRRYMLLTPRAFCGGAGTGKTSMLIAAVEDETTRRAWHDWERILAVTFMHGARRRLASRLRTARLGAAKFECDTIDSFCLSVANRFRRMVGRDLPILVSSN